MENEETLTCGSGNHNKIKADYAGIIARRVSIQKYKEATYFEILYLDTGDNVWHVGFGSYMLEFVEMWLNTEFEHTYKPITTAITDLLSRAEAAEAAQETLQRAMAEYKARAEKAEMDRDELFKLLDDTCKDVRERHVDDSVCGLCEYDGVHSSESGDCVNECPGFDMDDCFCMKKSIREKYGQKEE